MYPHRPSVDRYSVFSEGFERERVNLVLNLQHFCRQRLRSILLHNRNGFLKNNWTAVVLLVNKVNCRAADFCPRCKDRLMHVVPVHSGTAKRGKQRWMNIENPVLVFPHNAGWDLLEIS